MSIQPLYIVFTIPGSQCIIPRNSIPGMDTIPGLHIFLGVGRNQGCNRIVQYSARPNIIWQIVDIRLGTEYQYSYLVGVTEYQYSYSVRVTEYYQYSYSLEQGFSTFLARDPFSSIRIRFATQPNIISIRIRLE